MDPNFIIRPEELDLTFSYGNADKQFAFHSWKGTPEDWKKACREKLAALLGLAEPIHPGGVREVRRVEQTSVIMQAAQPHPVLARFRSCGRTSGR